MTILNDIPLLLAIWWNLFCWADNYWKSSGSFVFLGLAVGRTLDLLGV